MMLNAADMTTLMNSLQVPIIISDIIKNKAILTDDVEYGLHDLMSELQPDTALLCFALSAKRIAEIYMSASPSMRILNDECIRILSDYSELWIDHANDIEIEDEDVLRALSYLPEDLESMSELLDLNINFLQFKDPTAARLFEILNIQAKTQLLLAEELASMLNAVINENDTAVIKPDIDIAKPAIAGEELAKTDNVIPFPARPAS